MSTNVNLVIEAKVRAEKLEKLEKSMERMGQRADKLRAKMAALGDKVAKDRGFEKFEKNATNSISKVEKRTKAMAVAISAALVAPLAAFVAYSKIKFPKDIADIKEMSNASKLIGASVGEYQKMSYMAGRAGVNVDRLTMALPKMSIRIAMAEKGLGAASTAFEEFGVDAKALNMMSATEQFDALAKKITSLPNRGDRLRLTWAAFDNESVALLNLFEDNMGGIADEFDRLGLAMTRAQEKQVAAYSGTKFMLDAVQDSIGKKVAADVAPAFEIISKAVLKLIDDFGGVEVVANKFALAIVTAMGWAIKAVGGLMKAVNAVMIGMDKFALKNAKLELAREQSKAKGGYWATMPSVDDPYTGKYGTQTIVPGNDGQPSVYKEEITPRNSYIETIGVARATKVVDELEESILRNSTSMDNWGNAVDDIKAKLKANAEMMTPAKLGMNKVAEGFLKVYQSSDKVAQAQDQAAKSSEKAAKAADDYFTANLKNKQSSANQDQLQRIIGGAGGGTQQKVDPYFDKIASKILAKQNIMNSGKGSIYEANYIAGAMDDLERLMNRVLYDDKGKPMGNDAQKYAFEELKKFIMTGSMNPKEPEKTVIEISVKEDEKYKLEWTQKQVKMGVKDIAKKANKAASN